MYGSGGFLVQLAAVTATVAVFWLLQEQFEGRSAAGPALVLGGALLAWCLLRSAFTGVELVAARRPPPQQRARGTEGPVAGRVRPPAWRST
ncbi:hypothetical protein [Actinacidiphila acididurans]|uniref:Uncharacterized protein n=1 Tax=Actinacidiphila acididurans TaxID=2784346 RepID=A0ABS2TI81_9ACTN|nr:hypothetical protein [Actinacidiphila acididurans]MBM9503055.1 hypothetical protein [Actinacidiphila acididurans]